MRADEVMTAEVVTVAPETPVAEAVKLMLDRRVSGLPVVDGGGLLVGVITEGDLLMRAELGTEKKRSRWLDFLFGPGRSASEYVSSHGLKVGEVMTRSPIVCPPTASLEAVVGVMTEKRVKRVPIVAEGRLVGVVSRADVLRALSGAFAAQPASAEATADADLARSIEAALARESWAPRSSISIEAKEGAVVLWGTILDERQREAIRVVVEGAAPGRRIIDHMVWVEPFSGAVLSAPDEPAA
jgi:CBS domain-containing protein